MKTKTIYTLCAAIFLYTTSCAPNLATSTDTPPDRWFYGSNYPTDSLKLPLDWWRNFADTTLNNLVEKALLYNRDIEAAAARLQAAQESRRITRAKYLPSLSFGAEAEGTYTSSTKIVQEYTIEPTIAWEVSLFGALKQSNRKARAEISESLWAQRATRLSIAAEVATTYFTLRQAQCNLFLAQQSYELRSEESTLIDSMYHYGMSSNIARDQARSLLYSSRADIDQYTRAVAESRLTLATLIGENPDPTLASDATSITAIIPTPIPIGLPSDLLERRSDIQQSYYAMEAAAAEVGISRAARYPTISLTGSGGLFGYSLKDLTSSNPFAWSATGEIAETIFNFGALRADEKRAKAEYMVSLYEYEQSMLTAFAEVEKALISIESYATQRSSMVNLVRANTAISRSTKALYQNGMNDYLNVIDAERELYSSQMSLIDVITEQYISYITLYKALGGGY